MKMKASRTVRAMFLALVSFVDVGVSMCNFYIIMMTCIHYQSKRIEHPAEIALMHRF